MLIPSIDLSGGKAVQLRQGREKVLERDDPPALAREFDRFGEVAVVDLDAAWDEGVNDDVVRQLCRAAACRVGGGIRSVERARAVLSWGAERIVIGTAAFAGGEVRHDFLQALAKAAGRGRVVIALDARRGRILTDGWRKTTGLDAAAAARELEPYASELLVTCVEREGLMGGPDFDGIDALRRATPLRLTAAGGIASAADVRRLSRLGMNVQLGMALYTGALTAADAFAATVDWDRGPVPTVTRDSEGRVLMLAWSSEESLRRTFAEGRVWYWSRSRGRLWLKGETSGNVQALRGVRTDCDGDALLVTAEPAGPACHTGSPTCFGSKRFVLEDLARVIADRLACGEPGSYTASLSREAAAAKVMEEADEFVRAGTGPELVWEAADLVYFMLVRLAQHGIGWDEILGELARRRHGPRRGANGGSDGPGG